VNHLAEFNLWPTALPCPSLDVGAEAPAPETRPPFERQIDQIRQSLRDYGWQETAVLVDDEGHIIAGHGRVEAAKREGQTESRSLSLRVGPGFAQMTGYGTGQGSGRLASPLRTQQRTSPRRRWMSQKCQRRTSLPS
jgi:hypothetical protein